jgi:hypothetical protein
MKKIITLFIICIFLTGCSYKIVKTENEKDKQIKELQESLSNLESKRATTTNENSEQKAVSKPKTEIQGEIIIKEVPVPAPTTNLQPSPTPTPTPEPEPIINNSKEIETLTKEKNSITSVYSKFNDGLNQIAIGLTYSSEGIKYLSSYDYQTASVKFYSAIEGVDRAYNVFFNIDKYSTTCCTGLIGEARENYLQSVAYIKQGIIMYKKWADREAGANIIDEGKVALSKGLEYKNMGQANLATLMKILKEKTAELNALNK